MEPDKRSAKNHGTGRDAETDPDEEHHGVRQHQEGLLHLHPQHHSRRSRPYTGTIRYGVRGRLMFASSRPKPCFVVSCRVVYKLEFATLRAGFSKIKIKIDCHVAEGKHANPAFSF